MNHFDLIPKPSDFTLELVTNEFSFIDSSRGGGASQSPSPARLQRAPKGMSGQHWRIWRCGCGWGRGSLEQSWISFALPFPRESLLCGTRLWDRQSEFSPSPLRPRDCPLWGIALRSLRHCQSVFLDCLRPFPAFP